MSFLTERSSGGNFGRDQEPICQHVGRVPEAGGGSGGAAGPAEGRPEEPGEPLQRPAGHQDPTGAGDRRVPTSAGRRDAEVSFTKSSPTQH